MSTLDVDFQKLFEILFRCHGQLGVQAQWVIHGHNGQARELFCFASCCGFAIIIFVVRLSSASTSNVLCPPRPAVEKRRRKSTPDKEYPSFFFSLKLGGGDQLNFLRPLFPHSVVFSFL